MKRFILLSIMLLSVMLSIGQVVIRSDKEREQKEQQLDSFIKYAQAYIRPRIDVWQEKGEFEKLNQYQQRVTGANRQAMIDSLSAIAEDLFIKEHLSMNYMSNLQIGTYDSETEVFPIISSKFGQLLLPVPIAEASIFKNNFNSIKTENIQYYVNNDKIALRSVEFVTTNGKRYKYSNQNALDYHQYEFNPDALGLATINIRTGKAERVASDNKPRVIIISPQHRIIEYSTSTYTFNIDIRVGEGANPQLFVQINGGDDIALTPDTTTQKKGAVAVKGKSYTVNLPVSNPDDTCNLAFFAEDEQGNRSETQKCKMVYVGAKAKPTLHIMAVGVGDYQSQQLTKLSFPAKDAEDFVKSIKECDLSDYDHVAEPILLINQSATRNDIIDHLESLKNKAKSGDVLMLYMSGHGVKEGENAYFMAVDSDPNRLRSNGVSYKDIKDILRELHDQNVKVIIFMDACYAGMMGKKSSRSVATLNDADIVGLYSSTASEESSESVKDKNGCFTNALIEGLKGAAAINGKITVMSLYYHIVNTVKNDKDCNQNPVIENPNGDFKLFNAKNNQ